MHLEKLEAAHCEGKDEEKTGIPVSCAAEAVEAAREVGDALRGDRCGGMEINMFKEKCAEAEVEKIISYSEEKGYRENIKKEMKAWDSVERRSRDIWGPRDREYLWDDYERELFLESSWGDFIERDFWTGEPILKSYETWIENTMKITYQYSGQKYEKIIKCESYKNPYKVGQKLYVSFYKDSPDTIIDISDEDIFTRLRMLRYSIILLFFVVALMLLFYII